MASTINLGGIDLPDGIDTTTGEGRVYWPDRDSYSPIAMSTEETLGGRLATAQTVRASNRPITLELIEYAWLLEAPKDAILALSQIPGVYTLAWGAENYSVLFDHTAGPACTFEPLLVGRHHSKTHWVGTIRLLTIESVT
jgi:hypothetical protein